MGKYNTLQGHIVWFVSFIIPIIGTFCKEDFPKTENCSAVEQLFSVLHTML